MQKIHSQQFTKHPFRGWGHTPLVDGGMTRKYSLLLSILFFASLQLHAQNFNSPRPVLVFGVKQPTSLLSNWANRPELLNYIVNYEGPANFPAKIKVVFSKDGPDNIVGTSDLGLTPNTIFNNGTTVFQSKDVVRLEAIRFTGSVQKSLQASGRLPQGTYYIQLQILNAATLEPLTEMGTPQVFMIMSYQLPVLMKPLNKATLNAEQSMVAITFLWSPLAPAPTQERISYQLQIFEVQDGQTPMQAFRSNIPLLNEQVNGVTQYIWRPQLYLADSAVNHTYIWTIQTLDEQGIGFNNGVGDGRSEPSWFQIKSAKEIIDQRKQ